MHVVLIDVLQGNLYEVIYVVLDVYHIIVDPIYDHRYREKDYILLEINFILNKKNDFIPIIIHHRKKWIIDKNVHLT